MRKKTFRTGTGVFGEGRPKLCVPVVARTQEEIWKKAEECKALPVDIVEWRADFYEDIFDEQSFIKTLEGLKCILSDKALLFTFRTKAEGGNREISKERYYGLNRTAASTGCTDLIDIEAFPDEKRSAEEIRRIQASGSRVIASSHDFQKTPPVEEMARRFTRMEELGADVAKLAVTPASRRDVMNLLLAALQADEALSIPIVAMSMGRLGAISRVSGGLTGSAMTFASLDSLSAPGQMPVAVTLQILDSL